MFDKKAVAGRAVYETATEELEHRLRLDGQLIKLPSYARVSVETVMSATGTITIRIPVMDVQVVPADKRLAPKRIRKRRPKPAADTDPEVQELSDGD